MQTIVNRIKPDVVYEVIEKTPLDFAPQISRQYDNQIYLKREDLTPIHSFKIRGAYHKIRSLDKKQLKQGVITSSAGNHAQGVAFSAKKLGISATIVMPKITPPIKVDAVKALGAKVILLGDDYDECYQFAQQITQKECLTFIHPFDDIDVIAGQATIGYELLKQLSNIDYIFVPVGGGGLITGIASVIKSQKPSIKIIGVEPINSDALTQSIAKNNHVVLDEVDIFADGVATKQVGKENLRLAKQLVDDTILVSNDEMCAAIKDIYNQNRHIVEPSGALSLAGVKRYITTHKIQNKNIISIVSGANMNFDRLRYVAERAEIGEHKETIFAVNIPEQAGSFLKFCHDLNGYNITEFNYRYASNKEAHIFVGIGLSNLANKQTLLTRLSHYKIVDMSDNEMAKMHIRYMVGGRKSVKNEVIYRFIFPEKPGALLKFLTQIGNYWNISLFHYRNHGSDFGRVLVGFQADDIDQLEANLNKLNYQFHNETNNPAYDYFLT